MYFITMIEIKNGEINDTRCVGYVASLDKAKEILENNECDICETCYNYATIENIPEGIYQYDTSPIWFKFNELEEKYIECNKPEESKNWTGFAIG